MKVKDLIATLKTVDPEFEVVMSSDGEGNNYSPLAGLSVEMYIPESTWSGQLMHPDDAEDNDTEYKENAVVVWPTN